MPIFLEEELPEKLELDVLLVRLEELPLKLDELPPKLEEPPPKELEPLKAYALGVIASKKAATN